MNEYLHKSHNVTILLYHSLFSARYRHGVFDERVDEVLKEVCLAIVPRYQMKFLEIGTDKDHIHFWVQSLSMYSVTEDRENGEEFDITRDFQAISPREETTSGVLSVGRTVISRARSVSTVTKQ